MVPLCGLWGAGVLVASPALAQSMTADVEAFDEGHHGRLVVTFRDRTLLPEFNTRIANGVLVIDFAEPVKASVANVPTSLKKYISVALEDPAGFGLRFGLTDRYRVNTMEAGEKLFIDILPPDWQGAPPPLPDDVIRELAERAEEALRRVRDLEKKRFGKSKKPKVTLRVGRHPTFTRLSFFWNVPFDTNFQREGDLVRLVFSRDSDLNLFEVFAEKPPGLVDFDTFEEDKKLKIVLQMAENVDVRAFRETDAYVVDIAPQRIAVRDPANQEIHDTLREDGPAVREDLVISNGSMPGPANEGPRGQTDEGADVPAAPADRTFAEPAAVDEDIRRDPAAGAGEVPVAAASGTADPTEAPAADDAIDGSRQAGNDPQNSPGRPPAVDVAPPPTADLSDRGAPAAGRPPKVTAQGIPEVAPIRTAIAPIDPATDPLAAGPPRKVAIGSDGRVLDPDEVPARATQNAEGNGDGDPVIAPDLVEVEATRIGDLVRLVIPFKQETPAAVFKRHNSLWLVFDTDKNLGLDGVRTTLRDLAYRVIEDVAGDARTVRIDLKKHALATIGADGNTWVINIGDLILEPSKPVQFERHVRADGGMVLAAGFADPQRVHTIRDPQAKDVLHVVTGFGPARGIIKPQTFVEMDALTSAHGVAVVSRSDALRVRIKDNRVLVEQPRGLSLSSQNLAAGRALLPVKVAVSRPGFVDFNEMYAPHPVAFRKRKAALQEAISIAGEGSKAAEWLALARFYLANRFAQEARGILTLVRKLDPTIENDTAFLLMMGAAETLSGRTEGAKRYLLKHNLGNSPDGDVWRVIHYAQQGNWAEARKSFGRASKAIGNYPPNLQALYNISAAESAVELNDFGAATAILAEIDPAVIEPVYAARYDILRARLADVSARPEDAVKLLERVIAFGKRPSVAEATYRLLQIQRQENLRPVEEIVDELRRLSVIWRGDELELKTVRYLARLLVETGEYREALAAARNAILVGGDSDTARLLQDEMSSVFAMLFVDGKADDLEPVEALGLFYDFKEMTPVGRRGDTIVRNLAERLVDVDLLEQAAELLQHQVDNRLKGAARAQIAADLALIYLLDRKPDKALRALRRSRQARLPGEMERQRRLVESRALIEAGRYQTGLDLLATLRGPEVERMKADAYWYAKKWDDVGKQFESLPGGRWAMNAPLSEQDRLDVLKSAIGFSLAGNQLALDRLRTKFTDKMAGTEHSAAFEIVSRQINATGSEFSSIATQIAAVNTLEMFLKEYRQRYATGAVAADRDVGSDGSPKPLAIPAGNAEAADPASEQAATGA